MHVKTPGVVKWVDSNEVSSKLPMLDSSRGQIRKTPMRCHLNSGLGGRTFVPEMTANGRFKNRNRNKTRNKIQLNLMKSGRALIYSRATWPHQKSY